MTPEERDAAIAKILLEGGSLLVHPDTWAEYTKDWPNGASVMPGSGVPVETSRYVEPGKWYAKAKPKPLEIPSSMPRHVFDEKGDYVGLSVSERIKLVRPSSFAVLKTAAAEPEPWETAFPDSDNPWLDLLLFSVMMVAIDTHGLPPSPEERSRHDAGDGPVATETMEYSEERRVGERDEKSGE